MTASLTRRVARFAAKLSYEALTPDAVRIAKRVVLDSLGTAIAATTLGAGCPEVVEVMRTAGGPPESTILGIGARVGAANAAFANGALAHALNYDAVGETTGHTGVAALTAPLAAAEAAGRVDGRSFLTAVAVCAEITARLTAASALHDANRKLLAGQYFSYIGAAAGAGRAFGLDDERMHSAFGIALMQVAGARQVVVGGDPPAKAIYGAFPNHAGVLAAQLARAGLGAQIDALDGQAGFFAVAGGGADGAEMVRGLGKTYRFTQTQFKPWPVSGVVVPFIEAALDLALRHDLRPADIAAVELAAPPAARPWFEPPAERRRPSNPASAANAAPFATAKALVHRAVGLADFLPSGLEDPAALALAGRITHRFVEGLAGGRVEVTTATGARLAAHVERPLGDPSRPMSDAQLAAKFRDCCAYAASPLAPEAIDLAISLVGALEGVPDVRLLAAAVSPAAARRRYPEERP